jgi:tRNA dimethylallyltransferase
MAPLPPRLIAIVGPTGAGKSAVALATAHRLGGEIVSCDSLQVYRGLDIGSAKPTRLERAAIPHHLLDVVEPDEDFSAAAWLALAKVAIRQIEDRGGVPIVVGGTGLYLRALVRGLFEGPARDVAFRERLEGISARHGRARLHRVLRAVDPDTARRIAPADQVRVIRALEVFRATGRRMSAHHAMTRPGLPGHELRVFGVSPSREVLRERVVRRTDQMLEAGLLDEVQGLLARGLSPTLRPLQAIGYRQAILALREGHDGAALRRAIVTATMQYAKRQSTWFRHQAEVSWFPDGPAAAAAAQAWFETAR